MLYPVTFFSMEPKTSWAVLMCRCVSELRRPDVTRRYTHFVAPVWSVSSCFQTRFQAAVTKVSVNISFLLFSTENNIFSFVFYAYCIYVFYLSRQKANMRFISQLWAAKFLHGTIIEINHEPIKLLRHLKYLLQPLCFEFLSLKCFTGCYSALSFFLFLLDWRSLAGSSL